MLITHSLTSAFAHTFDGKVSQRIRRGATDQAFYSAPQSLRELET
jgi:hypothetical protein